MLTVVSHFARVGIPLVSLSPPLSLHLRLSFPPAISLLLSLIIHSPQSLYSFLLHNTKTLHKLTCYLTQPSSSSLVFNHHFRQSIVSLILALLLVHCHSTSLLPPTPLCCSPPASRRSWSPLNIHPLSSHFVTNLPTQFTSYCSRRAPLSRHGPKSYPFPSLQPTRGQPTQPRQAHPGGRPPSQHTRSDFHFTTPSSIPGPIDQFHICTNYLYRILLRQQHSVSTALRPSQWVSSSACVPHLAAASRQRAVPLQAHHPIPPHPPSTATRAVAPTQESSGAHRPPTS